MKIAVLYICTGEYIKFWPGFHHSAESYLLPGIDKQYFVFTDGRVESSTNIVCIAQDNLGWPFNTLYRFRIFLRIAEQLQSYDYVVFFNANCVIQEPIAFEEFFAPGSDLIACRHPGFFDKPAAVYSYERRPQSTAFVSRGTVYRAGGLMGGTREAFMGAAAELSANIDRDLENGIVALWHDESHWNAYLDRRAIELKISVHDLSPAYLYPEGWTLPFQAKNILREKGKVIDVRRIKGNADEAHVAVHRSALAKFIDRVWRSNLATRTSDRAL